MEIGDVVLMDIAICKSQGCKIEGRIIEVPQHLLAHVMRPQFPLHVMTVDSRAENQEKRPEGYIDIASLKTVSCISAVCSSTPLPETAVMSSFSEKVRNNALSQQEQAGFLSSPPFTKEHETLTRHTTNHTQFTCSLK